MPEIHSAPDILRIAAQGAVPASGGAHRHDFHSIYKRKPGHKQIRFGLDDSGLSTLERDLWLRHASLHFLIRQSSDTSK